MTQENAENKAGELPALPEFATPEEAYEWLNNKMDADEEECVDNIRFSFLDDEAGMQAYTAAQEDGCCGFLDVDILVECRPATIGCNFGH